MKPQGENNSCRPYLTRPVSMRAKLAVVLIWLGHIGAPLAEEAAEIGDATILGNSGGFVVPVTRAFGKLELAELYKRMQQFTSDGSLNDFTCGDPAPQFRYFLRLMPESRRNERLVDVSHLPTVSPGGPTRCLSFGLSYFVNRAAFDIDRGDPVDYGYRDPHTGKKLGPEPRRMPRKPVCRCELRGSGKEWVEWERSPSQGR